MAVTGLGTQASPHIITTWAEFIAQIGTAGTIDNIHYVKLGSDIDISDTPLTSYIEIANAVDVDGGGYTIKNMQMTHSNQYYGFVKADGRIVSGDVNVISTLHDITFENLLYTNTSGTANSYGLFYGVTASNSPDVLLGKDQFYNIKMSGKLVYTITPTTVLGQGCMRKNSFNFDYYAPALPTRGFFCQSAYDNSKTANQLRYRAYLSSTIAGVLWGQGGYNINYSKFQYNSLFAEINALEGCVTTTLPKLFYNASSYKSYPLDCYCVVKTNVEGLTIPLSFSTSYIYPTRLLYQNDGDNIATISTAGFTDTSIINQTIGCTEAQLKDLEYLNSIGVAVQNEVE